MRKKQVSGIARTWRCLVLTCLVALAMAPATEASQVTLSSREESYPPGVANITHLPWNPVVGQDVRVELRLAPDAQAPHDIVLIYCKVEPIYACGLPLGLEAAAAAGTWSGVIVWDERFFEKETVHVGYNVTMRFEQNDTTRRVYAPTGNYWVPDTYPADSDGVYYFLAYGVAPQTTPPTALPASLLALLGLAFLARFRGHARAR